MGHKYQSLSSSACECCTQCLLGTNYLLSYHLSLVFIIYLCLSCASTIRIWSVVKSCHFVIITKPGVEFVGTLKHVISVVRIVNDQLVFVE